MTRPVIERRRSAWAVRSASAVVAVVTLVGGLFTAGAAAAQPPLTSQSAPANVAAAGIRPATLAGFTPGNIISDAVFFNSGSMNESQIQSFLDGKVASCQSGYVCLKDFRQSTYTRPASLTCPGSYTGEANEPASRIVAKVAQACGINPQVLLTTLQKEQGLVTHTWPSDWRYTIAMGQGCPDTAACDTKYYGFFNQVYGAASQFKRYANPPGTSQYFTWYAPGKTWNVRYHPNVSCGSAPVLIQNQATANLYYYTPYQPNGAALAAGYREANDACSSYGNRNFYNYFTDWFGSTQHSRGAEISTAYTRYGGPAGRLGTSLGTVVCELVDDGCYQGFRGGEIHWSPSTGAFATFGATSAVWRGRGSERGPLGYPVGEETCGLPQGGCYQQFQGGFIHATPATGAHALFGEFAGVWARTDYERGPLGYPVGEETCGLPQGGCYQQFQGGFIHATPTTGTHATRGAIGDLWRSLGADASQLGYPTDEQKCGLVRGGCYQTFQNGMIHWSPGTGAHSTQGAVSEAWARTDWERGPFGYPTAEAECDASARCTQRFEGGVLP